ncbi:MAG: nicotinate-nucleotide diphosphorylase (carboxylating), partial [Myxococcota bacterium]
MYQVNPVWLREAVARALAEDVGAGDVTTSVCVDPGVRGRATVITRGDIVLYGSEPFAEVYQQIGGVEINFQLSDGDPAPAGATIAVIKGSLASILTGERTALNFMMGLSGIATLTSRFVRAVAGTKCI